MEAIGYIESEVDEPGIAIGSAFFDQYDSNSAGFDDMLTEEEAVSTERPMVAGNDAKVIRLLKAIKKDERLTDDQEDILEKLIFLWENGPIPAKISKDVLKLTSPDTIALYFDILNLVPPVYLEERKKRQNKLDGEKQVILSCYMEAKDNVAIMKLKKL